MQETNLAGLAEQRQLHVVLRAVCTVGLARNRRRNRNVSSHRLFPVDVHEAWRAKASRALDAAHSSCFGLALLAVRRLWASSDVVQQFDERKIGWDLIHRFASRAGSTRRTSAARPPLSTHELTQRATDPMDLAGESRTFLRHSAQKECAQGSILGTRFTSKASRHTAQPSLSSLRSSLIFRRENLESSSPGHCSRRAHCTRRITAAGVPQRSATQRFRTGPMVPFAAISRCQPTQ
jgi:hypothetical protein